MELDHKLAEGLRHRAGEQLQSERKGLSPPAMEETGPLDHELDVLKIELEMQNAELLQARDDMEAALVRYTELYDFAPVGYFSLDRHGIITAVNLCGSLFLGGERSRLVGGRFDCYLAPESCSAFAAYLEKAFATRTQETCEVVLPKEGKSSRFLQVEAIAEESGQECRIVLVDITERKLMESRLLDSEAHYRLLTEDVSDVVWKLSADYRFLYISPADERLRGYRSDEVIGRTIFEITTETDAAVLRRKFRKWHMADRKETRADTQTFEIFQICKEGRPVRVEMLSTPERDAHGTITGYHGIARDITERKLATKLEQQLLQAQKTESLGKLAGGVAHDFNNILLEIFNNAGLALAHLDKESPAVENLQLIQRAAGRGAGLTKLMLDYSGNGKFATENLDLNGLMEEMAHMLQGSVPEKTVVKMNPHRPLPPVRVDAGQLRQIIMNLVINASEAMDCDSGTITLSTGCLKYDRPDSNRQNPDENPNEEPYVYLEVADTGCGIKQETVANLFDPFFSTKKNGQGLRLAEVLGIVKGHQGFVRVNSEPGVGTAFRVLLPAGAQPADKINSES